MAYVNPLAYDNGLTWLAAQVEQLMLCQTEPTTYAEATATYMVARKTSGLTITGPLDGISVGGRKVRVAAFSQAAGMINSGTGRYWAWVNASNSRLLVVQECNPYIVCTPGSTLILDAPLEIEIPGVSG